MFSSDKRKKLFCDEIQYSWNSQRSDSLWRFACGDVFYLCLHGMPSKEKRLCCVLSQMLRLIECRGLTQILKFVAETQVEMQVGCIEFMDEAPGLKIKFKKFLHRAGRDCAHICHINFFLRFWKQYQRARMKISRTFKSSLGLSCCLPCLVLLPFVTSSPN